MFGRGVRTAPEVWVEIPEREVRAVRCAPSYAGGLVRCARAGRIEEGEKTAYAGSEESEFFSYEKKNRSGKILEDVTLCVGRESG